MNEEEEHILITQSIGEEPIDVFVKKSRKQRCEEATGLLADDEERPDQLR